MYYAITAVPHFIYPSAPSRDEALRELLEEYRSFTRFALQRFGSVSLHFRGSSERNKSQVDLGFGFTPDRSTTGSELSVYLRSLSRYLKLTEADPPDHESEVTLRRRVNLVAVGGVDVATTREMPVLPANAPRFLNFNPHIAVGDVVGVGVNPIWVIFGDWLRNVLPKQAYLAPVPAAIHLNGGLVRWKHTLSALAETGSSVTVSLEKRTPLPEEVDYAYLCLQYFVVTMGSKLPAHEMEQQTQLSRALIAREPVFDLTVAFAHDHSIVVDAFCRDTDPGAFARSTPDDAPRFSRRHYETSLQSALNRTDTGATMAPLPSVARYSTYCTLGQAVELIVPPYTFGDALDGVPHFVPKPFHAASQPLSREPFVGRLRSADPARYVQLGTRQDGQPIDVPWADLPRHTFVTGQTRSGKGNTIVQILSQAIANDVPVLIIDPVKRDYENFVRGSLGDSRIIDFGPTKWIMFNPFTPPDRIPIASHCVFLAKALSMLFPTNAVAHQILLSMLKGTYIRKWFGESCTTAQFLALTGASLRQDSSRVPTIDDFLDISLEVLLEDAPDPTQRSDYLNEAHEHFREQWKNLKMSNLYQMLAPHHSSAIDPEKDYLASLFSSTHLVEFTHWFDPNEVNAAFVLLFSMLYEYRLNEYEGGLTSSTQPSLHIAVLDEAHRIAPAEQKAGDARLVSSGAEAAQLVSHMIAECGALGQALIIAEQSASKIHRDVLVNTATKIIHKVGVGDDKDCLARALSLSDSEKDYMSYLHRGEGIIMVPDGYRPEFALVPRFPQLHASAT